MLTEELTELFQELYMLFHGIAGIYATLRLGYSGLKYISGYKDELPLAIRQVVIGLIVIYTAPTIVWIVEKFTEAIPTFGGF